MVLQRVRHSDGVHDGSQHTHGIPVGALHLIRTVLHAPPEIAAANYKPYLDIQVPALPDGFTDLVDHIKIQAPVSVPRKGLTADL